MKREQNRLFMVIWSFILFGIVVIGLKYWGAPILEPLDGMTNPNECVVPATDNCGGAGAPIHGTCMDSYGPNGTISANDQDSLSRCVDKPIPHIGTTASTHQVDMTTNVCSLINTRHSSLLHAAQWECPND